LGRSDCVDRASPITVILKLSCDQEWFDDYCGYRAACSES
jgi:hypothetical protein